MPTSVFLTTCRGIDSMPASRSNDPFVPIVATKSGESISCAIRENANFLSIEGPERGRLEIRIEPNAGRTPCHVNGEQVAEGALRSTGKRTRQCALLSIGKWWWLGRRATPRLGRRGKRIRRWLRAELTRFFYYDTQLEPTLRNRLGKFPSTVIQTRVQPKTRPVRAAPSTYAYRSFFDPMNTPTNRTNPSASVEKASTVFSRSRPWSSLRNGDDSFRKHSPNIADGTRSATHPFAAASWSECFVGVNSFRRDLRWR